LVQLCSSNTNLFRPSTGGGFQPESKRGKQTKDKNEDRGQRKQRSTNDDTKKIVENTHKQTQPKMPVKEKGRK
jgi:hypothetical protein